jgi:mRNA-degrading endonuclease RelE of RelBE toxin-antitoxin system
MRFVVRLTDSALEDLDYYRKYDRRIIADGIAVHLTQDADVETRRRRQLEPNPIAPWELRLGDFRVFYELEDDEQVKIVAIGHKEHNDLYILERGWSYENSELGAETNYS